MSKRDERSNQKRKKILEKSVQLFLENDINKVTIDEIAANANVSKMTIYKYFIDKERLFEEISNTILDRFTIQLKRCVKSEEDIRDKMINLTMVMIDFIVLDFARICTDISKINDKAKYAHDKFNQISKEMIMNLIKQGKNEKLLKDELSDEAIYYYIDMCLSYFYHNQDYREKIMTDAIFATEYMDFIWENIFIQNDLFRVSYEE